jgi:hypothetical protein
MTRHNKTLFSILLFALGTFFSNSAQAQLLCKQAVYLFRHAEDDNGLTSVGKAHAKLYPAMINQLQGTRGICPVQRVFAMWNRGTAGTQNPVDTARPLAHSINNTYEPEMSFVSSGDKTYYLCEYRDDATDTQPCSTSPGTVARNALMAYDGRANSELYLYLSNYLQAFPQSSAAIFYTSQGMPGVSTILGVNPVVADCNNDRKCKQILPLTSDCPLLPTSKVNTASSCYATPKDGGLYDSLLSWPGIQRSSANIFYYTGNGFEKQYKPINTNLTQLDNLLGVMEFQQCYDFKNSDGTISSSSYYCLYSGILANGITVPPQTLAKITGKICIAPDIVANARPGVQDSFGHCPKPIASVHDLDANMVSDVVWRDASGDIAVWLMNGGGVASSGGLGNVPMTWSIVGQRDFNGDGNADLLWHDTSGNVAIWEMNGATILNSNSTFVANVPTNWSIVGIGDFNADGMGDLLWQDASGNVAIWEMNGTTILNQNSSFVATVPGQWSIKGIGDFNGDGMSDVLWQDSSGNVAIWEMNGTTILNPSSSFVANVPSQWSIRGTGDFNGDGMSDILWQDTSGNVAIWEMNGTTISNSNSSFVGTVPSQWSIAETGDFDGDGKSDLLWRDASGNTAVWFMNGTAVASTVSLANVPTNWTVQAVNAE